MKASAVWIDGGQLYAFLQVMNPGPSVLVPWDMSLDKMKDRAREIRRIQLELTKVIAIEDGFARAEGLRVYVSSDVFEAQQLALSELGKSGPKAVATIRKMLSDPAFADEVPRWSKHLLRPEANRSEKNWAGVYKNNWNSGKLTHRPLLKAGGIRMRVLTHLCAKGTCKPGS
jgi:hypothetical protein